LKEANCSNVVFLPQTVQFYENKLAEALQSERYAQAVQLLSGMLAIPATNLNKRREWERLLDGIRAMFPELGDPAGRRPDIEAHPEAEPFAAIDEETFRIAALSRKINDEPDYADRLLDRLRRPHGKAHFDDVLLVLEQLAYADSDQVTPAILNWLSERERHPLLQFRALQTLKQRGVREPVRLPRNDTVVEVDLHGVPTARDEHPAGLIAVFELMREHCEARYPTLAKFLPDIERDFIAYAYGTDAYRELSDAAETGRASLWAAAMHAGLQRNIFHMENIVEICREYDIPSDKLGEWRDLYLDVERIFADMFKDRA